LSRLSSPLAIPSKHPVTIAGLHSFTFFTIAGFASLRVIISSRAAFLILSFDISASSISAPDDTDIAAEGEDGTPLLGMGFAPVPRGVKMEPYVMIGAKNSSRGWRCGWNKAQFVIASWINNDTNLGN
jgi:hypothetical protein